MPAAAAAAPAPMSRAQNATNLAWLLLIGLPPLVFGYYFTHHCQPSLFNFNAHNEDVWWMDKLSVWENTCRFGGQHPLLMANVLLFIKSVQQHRTTTPRTHTGFEHTLSTVTVACTRGRERSELGAVSESV